jgi:hypothetical protein
MPKRHRPAVRRTSRSAFARCRSAPMAAMAVDSRLEMRQRGLRRLPRLGLRFRHHPLRGHPVTSRCRWIRARRRR